MTTNQITVKSVAIALWITALLMAGMALGANNRYYLGAAFVAFVTGVSVEAVTAARKRRSAQA